MAEKARFFKPTSIETMDFGSTKPDDDFFPAIAAFNMLSIS